MRRERHAAKEPRVMELCTFYISTHQFGIDILTVQEINKNPTITTVPQSQDYVIGVMNLRGRIITVIDLGKKLGLSATVPTRESRTIIVNSQGEYIGILVDRIGDVVPVDNENVEAPPVNIDRVLGHYTQGVLKIGAGLIGILDVEAALA